MADMAQYETELEAYTYGKDPLVMQSYTPRIIAMLIAGIPEQVLRQRPFSEVVYWGDHCSSRRGRTRHLLAVPADD